ncbi:unnamed protein product, partial [Oikopleura dioica]
VRLVIVLITTCLMVSHDQSAV